MKSKPGKTIAKKQGGATKRFICLCTIPTFILYFIFVIYPIFNMVGLSFVQWNGLLGKKTFYGLKNYQLFSGFPVLAFIQEHLDSDCAGDGGDLCAGPAFCQLPCQGTAEGADFLPHRFLHSQHPFDCGYFRYLLHAVFQ